jgi:hypothetical protein
VWLEIGTFEKVAVDQIQRGNSRLQNPIKLGQFGGERGQRGAGMSQYDLALRGWDSGSKVFDRRTKIAF